MVFLRRGGSVVVELPFGLCHPHTSRQHKRKATSGTRREGRLIYSVEAAPRWPELKLSMYRMHRCSSGTVVPPDVTHTIGRLSTPPAAPAHKQRSVAESHARRLFDGNTRIDHAQDWQRTAGLINYLR